jgi:probable rRNA maturation factor
MSGRGDSSRSVGDLDAGEDEPLLRLSIVREAGEWSAFDGLAATARRAAAALAKHPQCRLARGSEASLVLGSDALLRRLNRTYRGLDAATNVLSFAYQKPAGGGEGDGYLGDVILAQETVQREAIALGITPGAHLQHLLVHGLLHLLGRDHACAAEADAMEALETEILAAVGVADPYAVAS